MGKRDTANEAKDTYLSLKAGSPGFALLSGHLVLLLLSLLLVGLACLAFSLSTYLLATFLFSAFIQLFFFHHRVSCARSYTNEVKPT